jgi:hypothetical protein
VAAYTAVIECDPTARDDVLKVAEPALSVPVPIDVVPSLNVTVPVGVPLPGAVVLTVAVNVTDWPNTDGFVDDATVVLVAAAFTVCVRLEELLAEKFESPA